MEERGNKNWWEWDGQVGGGMKGDSNERGILIERAIIELWRDLGLRKHPGTNNDDPS